MITDQMLQNMAEAIELETRDEGPVARELLIAWTSGYSGVDEARLRQAVAEIKPGDHQ